MSLMDDAGFSIPNLRASGCGVLRASAYPPRRYFRYPDLAGLCVLTGIFFSVFDDTSGLSFLGIEGDLKIDFVSLPAPLTFFISSVKDIRL